MDNWLLEQIRQGMIVYDANGDEVGKVKSVFFGGRPDHDPTLLEELARVFEVQKDLPESLENRLRRDGFVVVDRSMARDPYVFPDQIAVVSGDEITLRAGVDDLFVP
jgi:hypothetical protein